VAIIDGSIEIAGYRDRKPHNPRIPRDKQWSGVTLRTIAAASSLPIEFRCVGPLDLAPELRNKNLTLDETNASTAP
jgi:hypothetical protein